MYTYKYIHITYIWNVLQKDSNDLFGQPSASNYYPVLDSIWLFRAKRDIEIMKEYILLSSFYTSFIEKIVKIIKEIYRVYKSSDVSNIVFKLISEEKSFFGQICEKGLLKSLG